MRCLATLAVVFVLAGTVSAQMPGDCEHGQATATLDDSDVRASFPNTGTLFYGPGVGSQAYKVPQLTDHAPLYSASVWIGGMVGGEFRVAGTTYAQATPPPARSYEFWPGPLDAGATLPNPTDCSAFDRIWVVSAQDVADYDAGASPTDDLADWPVGLGAPAMNVGGDSIVPTSRGQMLDLTAGERPVVFGTQTAFWVMNDVGNDHESSGSQPMGIEVAVTAFAVASTELSLHQSTFYRYKITNRNTVTIEKLRLGIFSDVTAGPSYFAGSYFAGSDTTRSMGYSYLANTTSTLYSTPPAIGFDVLGGSSPLGRPQMTAFMYGTGSGEAWVEPYYTKQYIRVLSGIWPDGVPLIEFGPGRDRTVGEITTYAFPGDPVTQSFWSEENTGEGRNTPRKRQIVVSSELGGLIPGASATVDIGLVFAQGTDRLASVTQLRAASDDLQARYDAGTLFAPAEIPTGPPPPATTLVAPVDGAGPFEGAVALTWEPVAGTTDYLIQTSESPDFTDADFNVSLAATTTFSRTEANPFGGSDPTIYWRVRARRGAILGEWSEARTFVYRLRIGFGLVGVVEVVGPGGAAPCGDNAVSLTGCPEPGDPLSLRRPGNGVYFSLDGAGAFAMSFLGLAGSGDTAAHYAPHDFEIRVVPADKGSYGYYLFSSGRVIRVPFQIWDIGDVAPGEVNDPADDIQMIPVLYADAGEDAASECTFRFSSPTPADVAGLPGIGAASQRIYAYYPSGDDYAAFEAEARALVAADPDGCPIVPQTARIGDRVDTYRGRPIQRDVFVQAGETESMADLEGVVVRYYTEAQPTPAEPALPSGESALALAAPFPNPASTRVTIRYRTDAPGPIRLTVVDLLGREVVVLADGAETAGDHERQLGTGGLAAGVYAVVLEAGGRRVTRMLTVAR